MGTVQLHRILKASPEKIYRAFLELVPNQRIRHTDSFDDPAFPEVIEVTVEVVAPDSGLLHGNSSPRNHSRTEEAARSVKVSVLQAWSVSRHGFLGRDFGD